MGISSDPTRTADQRAASRLAQYMDENAQYIGEPVEDAVCVMSFDYCTERRCMLYGPRCPHTTD